MEIARTLAMRDGACIAYRVRRPEERARRADRQRALVLLHGLASNLTRWSEFVEQTNLGARWDLIRVDLRGHGASDTRGAIGLEIWCDDLAAILAHEGHDTAVLVGHSLGAQVALHFAMRHARRTAGLALIDPVFRQALHGKWKLLAAFGPLLHGAAHVVRALNALGLRRRSLPPLDLRQLDEMARKALLSQQDTEAFVRHYSSTRADLQTFHTAHYLQELVEMFRPVPPPQTVGVPVLVLLSSGGTFANPRETETLALGFPQGQIVRIECEHWPLTESPGEVRAAIEQWCASLTQCE